MQTERILLRPQVRFTQFHILRSVLFSGRGRFGRDRDDSHGSRSGGRGGRDGGSRGGRAGLRSGGDRGKRPTLMCPSCKILRSSHKHRQKLP